MYGPSALPTITSSLADTRCLMALIQERFGVTLPLSALFHGANIEAMAPLLREQVGAVKESPLVAVKPGGSRPPLFLVHPIGGGVMCYAELARVLDDDQPLYAFEAIEPGSRDMAPENEMRHIVSGYLSTLREVQPEGPYHLGGWSHGGSIALEMARQLKAQGQAVAPLILIDSWAPIPEHQADRFDEAMLAASFAGDLSALAGKPLTLTYEALRACAPGEHLTLILKNIKERGILPRDTAAEDLERRFLVFKSNWLAVNHSRPSSYDGSLVLFRSSEPLGAGPDARPPYLGWERIKTRPVKVIPVPGNHYTMLAKPHVHALAEKINQETERLPDSRFSTVAE